MEINVEDACNILYTDNSLLNMDIKSENFTFICNLTENLDPVITDSNQIHFKNPQCNDLHYGKPGLVLIGKRFNGTLTDTCINVISCKQVSKVYFGKNGEENVDVCYIPHIITEIRSESQKDQIFYLKVGALSATINVIDIIVHPSCLKKVESCSNFCTGFVDFVISTVRKYAKIDVKLDILGFNIYIGNSGMTADKTMIHLADICTNSNIENIGKIVSNENTTDVVPLEEANKMNGYDNKLDASYKLSYKTVDTFEALDRSFSVIDKPNLLAVEFFLPEIDCIEDIDIETDGKELKLKAKNNIMFDIKLDFEVLREPMKSIFFKDRNILYLELKINYNRFQKINLCETSIATIKDDCSQKDTLNRIIQMDVEKTEFILPIYKVTQSMTDYALTINSNCMVRDSLKHVYIGSNVLEVSYDKYVASFSPAKCRLIFDVSPKRINCANSFLNQGKKHLTFTIRKLIPKISVKAKIGSTYDSLEEIKVLYFERKYAKKKGKQSEWIKECPERVRSLSESAAFDSVNEEGNFVSRSRRIKQCNGSLASRRKSEYFLTSSWPKGILKRSNSESAYATPQDNVFVEDETGSGWDKFDNRQSLDSLSSICKTSTTDSGSCVSGLESSLEDLSIESYSPQKKVVFTGVILKEVYKENSSIMGTKNRREYRQKREVLSKKLKKGNSDSEKELRKLNEAYKDSQSMIGDESIDSNLNMKASVKQGKKHKRKKEPLQHLDKEDLIFSFDDEQ